MKAIQNYIGGEFRPPEGGEYLDNENPATGEVYARVPDSDERDASAAVAAAAQAAPAWAATPLEKRRALLRQLAELIRQNKDQLVRAESIDTGKPVRLAAAVDIPRASQNLEFFADAALNLGGDVYPMDEVALNYTRRAPLGAVVCISPWNLPLYLLTWKIAPALITGNTVIAKPSEVTPATAHLLAELCREANVPPGVLNILHGVGSKLGETLCTHPQVAAVSFTGSTATGKTIQTLAAPLFKKVSLEMGGKNPTVVFADCDFAAAVKNAALAAFSNQGQICLCGSRILIERPIYEKFKEALLERAAAIRIGDPLDPATQHGAMVSRAHFQKVLSCIALAKEEGGRVLCGGTPAELPGANAAGYFIKPTLIEGLGMDCRTNREEIFGPVATLIPFDREEQAVEWANGTSYGLSASVWSQNVAKAHRVAHKISSGVVWINSWMLRDLRIPFGGMKSSGVGREGGTDSLNFFTEVQTVCLKVAP